MQTSLKQPTKRQKKQVRVRSNILQRRRIVLNNRYFKHGIYTQDQIDQWKLDEELKRKRKEERKKR